MDRRGPSDLIGAVLTSYADLQATVGREKPLIKRELLRKPGYVNSGVIKVLCCREAGTGGASPLRPKTPSPTKPTSPTSV